MTTSAPAAVALPAVAHWDDFYRLPGHVPSGIRCGACTDDLHEVIRHTDVATVRACHLRRADWAAEAAAEQQAESAWLRHAEAGNPDTWREEDLERMAAASGLPMPPGMY